MELQPMDPSTRVARAPDLTSHHPAIISSMEPPAMFFQFLLLIHQVNQVFCLSSLSFSRQPPAGSLNITLLHY